MTCLQYTIAGRCNMLGCNIKAAKQQGLPTAADGRHAHNIFVVDLKQSLVATGSNGKYVIWHLSAARWLLALQMVGN